MWNEDGSVCLTEASGAQVDGVFAAAEHTAIGRFGIACLAQKSQTVGSPRSCLPRKRRIWDCFDGAQVGRRRTAQRYIACFRRDQRFTFTKQKQQIVAASVAF